MNKIVEFSISLVYCIALVNFQFLCDSVILFVDTTGHLKGLFLIHVHDESGSSHQCHASLTISTINLIPNHRLLQFEFHLSCLKYILSSASSY